MHAVGQRRSAVLRSGHVLVRRTATIETEEAFVSTPALGHGLTLKGGGYFSGIGYENSVHQHAWDFVDPALVQQAFLATNFAVDGIQASWIAPLSGVPGAGR